MFVVNLVDYSGDASAGGLGATTLLTGPRVLQPGSQPGLVGWLAGKPPSYKRNNYLLLLKI